ncbi:MAG: 2Fe-2S iron-sulfur cluster-binding protein [Candidatus Rokubacteria bacterium]|nr:2Fe-2S iron-sulfur cluster-binding protein [Candidatus Rokubacteria bacterium]
MSAATGPLLGRLRLVSGLVLFSFVSTHLLNHALGLVSLDAMEAGRSWFLLLWRNALGTALLYGALLIHVLLALRSIYRRRTLRMPAWEAVQVLLGLAIPVLLISHVMGTRVSHDWFGANDSYRRILLTYWILTPSLGAQQVGLLTVAWTHGAVGLHFWLRLRPGYARVAPFLLAGAVLLPTLAVLGFVGGGREVARLAQEPGWIERTLAEAGSPDPESRARLLQMRDRIRVGYVAAVALVLAARAARRAWERRVRGIRIGYPDGREVTVPIGFTVLEASRAAGIRHASVCGGRARCSTCRVRVTRGLETLPPATAEELRVLARVGAPQGVRLACQLRPPRDLTVVPLVPVAAGPAAGRARPGHHAGAEREVAVLFADLRGFTTLAEPKLPFDVVFFLNQYFEAVGTAIERTGGVANQFTGDGVMALFGVDTGADDGCRQALRAAREMVRGLAPLGRTLGEELAAPLRLGIGIHVGPAVVGRMGYKETVYLTAVGDTVHVASRFQDLTKEYDCVLVISEEVARRAGVDPSRWPRHEITVRNRRAPIAIRVVEDVEPLGEDAVAGSA